MGIYKIARESSIQGNRRVYFISVHTYHDWSGMETDMLYMIGLEGKR